MLTPGRWFFLARADIFKNKKFAWLLYFLKILPVYRIRDGFSSLQKNDEIFNKTIDVLKSGKPLGILPEGTHEPFKILRPLKKGLARIAFNSEEILGKEKGVNIIPVGLDYSDYYSFRNKLVVNFGKPIAVADFMAVYQENNAKGLLELTAAVRDGMKEVMIHVDNPEIYNTISGLANLNLTNRSQCLEINYYHCFLDMQETVNRLNQFARENPEFIAETAPVMEEYDSLMKELKFNNTTSRKKYKSLWEKFVELLVLTITFPIYLTGLIFNYLPYKFPELLTSKIKDLVFHASFKFVIWLLLFPLYYLVLCILFFPLFS